MFLFNFTVPNSDKISKAIVIKVQETFLVLLLSIFSNNVEQKSKDIDFI